MAAKYKLTRPELKRFRDALGRYQRFLPMLKLKQQQLQMAIRNIIHERQQAHQAIRAAQAVFEPYQAILHDRAGINLRDLATPAEIQTTTVNIAGVSLPIFQDVVFPPADYSLFATPAWVDKTLLDMRQLEKCRARLKIVEDQYRMLQRELTKISQRVNLFEKVKIPETREIIRRIRIRLGDEMTAGVGRAKIAKSKISTETDYNLGADPHEEEEVVVA